jgi:phosphopantetheine--protein transferase-like protein
MAIKKSRVYGCGIDIEELNRFDKLINENDYSLMSNICSKRELENLNAEYLDQRVRLALSFTFKEAIYKALGKIWATSDISWKDIEFLVESPDFKNYRINLSKKAKDILFKNNITLKEIHFTYNEEYVVFQIIIVNTVFAER